MAELILARHGETVWNIEKIYRGRTDVNLDNVGIKKAEILSKYLGIRGYLFQPIKEGNRNGKYHCPISENCRKIAEGLIDFDYGEWQSLPEQVGRASPRIFWRHFWDWGTSTD